MPITMDDLNANDMFRHQMVELVKSGEYPSNFEADLGTGEEVELCEGGSKIEVTADNRERYAELYLEKYVQQDKLIYDTIHKGIRAVTCPQTLGLLTPSIANEVPFASPQIDPDIFVELIRPRRSDNEVMKRFY